MVPMNRVGCSDFVWAQRLQAGVLEIEKTETYP